MDHWKPISGICTVTKGYTSSSTDTVFTVEIGDQVELLAQYDDTWILIRSISTDTIGTVPVTSLSSTLLLPLSNNNNNGSSLSSLSTGTTLSTLTGINMTGIISNGNNDNNDSRSVTPVESSVVAIENTITNSVTLPNLPIATTTTTVASSSNNNNSNNNTNPSTNSNNEAPLTIKMERVSRTWRSNLRRALAAGDRTTYEKLSNQVSQLSEWRRQKLDIEESINLLQNNTSTVNINTSSNTNSNSNNNNNNNNNSGYTTTSNGNLFVMNGTLQNTVNTSTAIASSSSLSSSSSSSISSSTINPPNYYSILQKENIGNLSSSIVASSSKKLAMVVNESILNLIESTTQQREGLVTPRTDTDEPANEENTGIMSLLRMHTDSEKRLQTSSKVPTSASEALVAEVTKGIHGGPTVTNERATDVSGLWNSAAPDININSKTISPMESIAEGLALLQSNEVSHSIVQLLIELQTIPAFRDLGTNGILIISVWDAISSTFVSQDAAVTFDASGRPLIDSQLNGSSSSTNTYYWGSGNGGTANSRPAITLSRARSRETDTTNSQQSTWSQCLFINIPRTLITLGKSYVVFRLFRRGALKETRLTLALGPGGATNPASTNTNNNNLSLTTSFINSNSNSSTNKNSNLLSSSSLSTRFLTQNTTTSTNGSGNAAQTTKGSSNESLATYIRPLGTAILPLPTVLPRLADGTPHRPAEPIVFMRPSKGEESRYFGLHRVLIAEKERDIEQEGRRKALSGLMNTGMVTTAENSSNNSTSNNDGNGNTGSTNTNGNVSSSSTDGIESTMQLVRCSRIGALPIVVRCFSTLSLPTLTDIRYNHLFSALIKHGNVAYPLSWTWGPTSNSTTVPSFIQTMNSTNGNLEGAPVTDTSTGNGNNQDRSPVLYRSKGIGSPNESSNNHNGFDTFTVNGIWNNYSNNLSNNKLFSSVSIDITSLALSGVHILPKTFDFALMSNNPPVTTNTTNNAVVTDTVLSSSPSASFSPVSSVIPQGLSQLLHRDVLYVTLRKGLFTQDKKMSPRNVQVRVTVLTHRGEMLPCLLRGVRCGLRNENPRPSDNYLYAMDNLSGKENSNDTDTTDTMNTSTTNSPPIALGVPEYRSSVYYHCNSPVFDETLSILIPSMEQFETSHILFTFWHASSTITKTDPFAFTFLPLADITGAALRDGKHILRCYRPTANIQAGRHNSLPTYLVSPVVDSSGLELIPPTPVPYITRSTNNNSTSTSENGILSADHVRSACNRHIPITAMPIHLGSTITSSSYSVSATSGSTTAFGGIRSSTGNVTSNGNVTNKISYAPIGSSVFGLSSSSLASTVNTVNTSGSVGALSASFIAGAKTSSSSLTGNGITMPNNTLSNRGQRAALLGILNRPSATTNSATLTNDKTSGTVSVLPSANSNASDWNSAKASKSSASATITSSTMGNNSATKENGSFKQWSTRVRSTSMSIINNLGLETNRLNSSNNSTELNTLAETEDDSNVQKLTELEPLLIRKDTFEIETRLVSDAKSSIAELHTLQRWKLVSKATLHTALVSLTTLISHPRLLLRIFPKLLTILCEILSSFANEETNTGSGATNTATNNNMPLSNSGIEKPNSKVLSATLTLLVAVFDCLFSDFRIPLETSSVPSSGNTYNHKLLTRMDNDMADIAYDSVAGGIMDNYGKDNRSKDSNSNYSTVPSNSPTETSTNWPSPSSTWLPSMRPPAGDGFIRSHILEAYLRTDFSSPSLHRILLPALNALATAALHAPFHTNEETTVSSLQLPIPDSSNTLPYPFIFQYKTVIRSFNSLTALLQLVLTSFKQAEVEYGGSNIAKGTDAPRLPKEFGKFRTQLASLLSLLISLVQRSHEYSNIPQNDNEKKKKNDFPFPVWILMPQCCIYRQFVDILLQLESIVTKEETIALYQRILTAIPIIHWSHVKSFQQIPTSLRISLLLCCRSLVANNLLADKIMYHALVPSLVKILSAYMNSSSVARAISLRIVTALLQLRESFAKQINRQSKGKKMMEKNDDFSRENWCFSLLLAELTRSTLGIAQGVVAPGDIVASTGYYRAAEDAVIVHNLRVANIAIPEPPWLGVTNTTGSTNTDNTANSTANLSKVLTTDKMSIHAALSSDIPLAALDKLCCVLPEVVHEEVYGPNLNAFSTMGTGNSTISSTMSDSTFARSTLEVSAFVEKGLRSAITSWMSLVWSISDANGANLLGSVAPLQISYGQWQQQINRLVDSTLPGKPDYAQLSALQRIRLGCQLLHTSIQFLGLATQPSSWLVMNMLLHSCILKLYRWIASFLASCYRGTLEDDELFASLSATKMLTTMNTIAASSSTTTRNINFSSSFAAHKLVSGKFSWCLAKPLWELFVEVTIALLTSPLFAPETLRPVRRQAVAERYGDRRSEVVKIFRQTWAGILATSTNKSSNSSNISNVNASPVPVFPFAKSNLRSGPLTSVASMSSNSTKNLLTIPEATFYQRNIFVSENLPSSTIPDFTNRSIVDGNEYSEGICASLRLSLSSQLVASMLDLTHCMNNDVATLARDVYLDLIRAELRMQKLRCHYANTLLQQIMIPTDAFVPSFDTIPLSFINFVRSNPNVSVIKNLIDERFSGLPEIERLTIDAIDILVARKGPSLVIPRSSTTAATNTNNNRPKISTLRSVNSSFMSASPANTGSSSLTPSSARTLGGGTSNSATKGKITTGNTNTLLTYVPPSDNLIMSLFAPKRLQGSLTAKSEKIHRTSVTNRNSLLSNDTSKNNALTGRSGIVTMTENLIETTAANNDDNIISTNTVSLPSPDNEENDPTSLLRNRTVVKFLGEIRMLYAMLSALSRYPATPEWEDERAQAALTLINYLRTTHRTDMYAKYVTYLTEMHTTLNNYAEAALSFLLHADILDWSDIHLWHVRSGDRDLFPAQTSAARLEAVLLRSVSALSSSQCWEEAAALSEVLLRRYESVTIEYSKLAELLRVRATLFDRMARAARIHPQYFIVMYNGTGFPKNIRGKMFIYRGGPSERIIDFEERLLKKWPQATKATLTLTEFSLNNVNVGYSGTLNSINTEDSLNTSLDYEPNQLADDDDDEGNDDDTSSTVMDASSSKDTSVVKMEISFASVTVVSSSTMIELFENKLNTETLDPVTSPTVTVMEARRAPYFSTSTTVLSSPLSSSRANGTALYSPLGSSMSNDTNTVLISPSPSRGLIPVPVARSVGAALHSDTSLLNSPPIGGTISTNSFSSPTVPSALLSSLSSAGIVIPVLVHVGTTGPSTAILTMDNNGRSIGNGLNDPTVGSSSSTLASPTVAVTPGKNRLTDNTVMINGNPNLGTKGSSTATTEALSIPQLIRQGRDHAGVRYFLYQRPFRYRTEKSNNEYLDMWIRKYFITTMDAFPTTHRRSLVISIKVVILNPIEAAITVLNDKTMTLQDLIEKAAAGPDRQAEQSFTQALQGVVDAAVSGGISNYRPFFTGEFRTTHPEIAKDLDTPYKDPVTGLHILTVPGPKNHLMNELRFTLLEQIRTVARGIRVHAIKCSEDLLPLHAFLCERFDQLTKMIKTWGI